MKLFRLITAILNSFIARVAAGFLLMMLIGSINVFATVAITTGTFSTPICTNSAADGSAPAWTTVTTTTLRVREANGHNGDFGGSAGAWTSTITFTAPAGWAFNTTVLPTYAITGGADLTTVTGVFSGGNLVLTLVGSGNSNRDGFYINGLQVRATTSNSTGFSANGSITNTASTNMTIVNGQDAGDLSQTPQNITGSTSVCAGGTITLTDGGGGTWSSSNTLLATVSGGGVVTGVAAGTPNITYTLAGCTTWLAVTVLAGPNVSVFTSPSATSPAACSGASSTVTVNSTSLGAGTFTATYNLSGASVSSGNTATLTMGVSNGTFTIPSALLTGSGSTTVTITSITNASGCISTVSSSNTASFTVSVVPNVSNFTSPSATTACSGSSSTATVNSTTLGTGTFTATYNLSGANTSSGNTATLTMGVSNGTFTIPSAKLASSGATTVTITAISNASGCSSTVSSSNTATFTVNPTPTVVTPGNVADCNNQVQPLIRLSGSVSGTAFPWTNSNTAIGLAAFGPATGTLCDTVAESMYVHLNAPPGSVFTAVTFASYGTPNGSCGSFTIGACNAATSLTFVQDSVLGHNSATIQAMNTIFGDPCVGTFKRLYVQATYTDTTTTIPSFTATNAGSSPISGTITITPTANGCTGTPATFTITVNPSPNVSVFTSPSVISPCLGSPATATVNSTSLGAGTFTVTYNLSAPNLATGLTATLTMGASTGTFTIPSGALTSTGATTLTITSITNSYGCSNNISSSNTASFNVNANPNITNFTSPSATSPCLGSASTATVNSTTLGAGTFTATYSLSGANTSAGNTATLTMGVSNGTFTIPSAKLASAGATTVTITAISNASGCSSTVSSSNTASFTVNANPNITNFTSPSATSPCLGSASTTTVNSTTLGAGTFTATYSLSGANTSAGNTATLTMGVSNGTFTIPSAKLASAGATTVTITGISNGSGCSTTVSSSNTASFNVNANPNITNFTSPSATSPCLGSASTATVNSTTLGSGTFTATYSLSGANTSAGNIATLTMGVSNGTFTIPSGVLASTGATTVTITAISNASGCSTTVSSSNTASFTVNANPNITNFTSPSATSPCLGSASTATVNSTTLGAGTFTATYSLSGANTSAGNTATLTMGVSNGTFAIPSAKLASTGATTITITAITNASGCSSTVSSSNTASFTVNALPNVSIFTSPSATSPCFGSASTATVNSITLGAGTFTATYNLSGANTSAGNTATLTMGLISGTFAISSSVLTSAGATTVTITAISNGSGCSSTVSSSNTASFNVNANPTAYAVTGGGSYCSGGAGVHVGLANSDAGVNYSLYRGGTTLVITLAGTGAALDFGPRTAANTFTVVAINASTGCTSNMSGSAVITILPAPTVYAVTGGGGYCTGGSGLHVGISNSDAGINYQLYNYSTAIGGPMAGTGAALDFGLQITAGVYTVIATNTTTGCTQTMPSSVSIIINPLPTTFAVTGGGGYCTGGSGVPVGLSSTVMLTNYQLYNGALAVGSPVAGTGTTISFGSQTTAGTYTVVATNTVTACINTMTGSAVVSVNPLPTSYSVTGGGSYCAGGTGISTGVSNSQSGVNYQLYNGVSLVGSPVAGTGAAISFGLQTAAGTYTVVATNATTSCVNNMSGSAVISVNPLPTSYSVTGGGSYCAGGTGILTGVSNSQSGVNYQLYNGVSLAGSPVAGTGTAISFGLQTAAGTYTVVATNATTSCINNMSGSAVISVNPVPTSYSVTGGGSYCAGGTGISIGVSNSQSGVNYQLYNGASAVGSPVAGAGAAISFGLQTAAGTYTVVATDATTSCVNNMSGSAVISVNPLPTSYSVTGGGTYCAGGTGVTIGLSSSNAGINYQLYNGTSTVGSPVAGTGAAISCGLQTTSGTYTIIATDAISGCTNTMSGSATVTINSLPVAVLVTGGGFTCSGGPGVAVTLAGSAVGINYQLYRGVTPIGAPVAGFGYLISFGLQTVAGVYTVIATNSVTGCVNNMSGSVTVTISSLPTVYAVTGGGSYCTGGTGVTVGLGGSDAGVNYQLYNGITPSGSPVPGTGASISFGLQTAAGTYTIVATNPTTSCTNNMSGSAVIAINPLPTSYSVTGGGSYCLGGTGVAVGLGASDAGINYQLYSGASAVGSPIAGTGGTISFGSQTAGTYTVVATNATTSCVNNMAGSATVSTYAPLTVYTVTGGGGYCPGGSGVTVGLGGSDPGINYQLYNGASAVGGPITGTGAIISYGPQTATGTYTVVATNPATTCTSNMPGSAVVSVNPLPTSYSITGGGGYCPGGTGVIIGLGASDAGINYQLYNGATPVGSPVAGTGAAISFGLQTAVGTYTIVATNATTSCVNNMAGSVAVSINPLPFAFSVTGGGSYCSGGTGATVGLSSSVSSTNYQLYVGASAVGSPVAGTGAAINFGLQTTAGTYTVIATNTTTTCANNMSGSAVVSINALPTSYSVTGGGSYCSGGTGVTTGLSGSDIGINYQLFNGASPVGSPIAGTGAALSYGPQTATGTYTVVATNATNSCLNNMAGNAVISINLLPTSYSVTGGGSYCLSGIGVAIGLGASDAGINYQLYNGTSAVGSPVAGTGAAISFGSQTATGTYTAVATNATTACVNNMAGSATVNTYAPLTVYTVTGGGGYCIGGPGVIVNLNGSDPGINYQLYDGASAVGGPTAGTGAPISYGSQTAAGTYTVVATNPATTCTSSMSASAVVSINPLPTSYSVTGGGSYCAGGTGVAIGLGNSQSGVNYQLYNGSTTVGSPVAGTGAAISFGLQTAIGTYAVVATDATTSCVNNMSGSATITTNPVPTVISMTGGGSYCPGGTGVNVGLAASITGFNYQLYNGTSAVGSPVTGVGFALNFGSQTVAGTYTAVATDATTGCSSNMSGSAVVSIYTAPTVYAVTGGGNYCAGGTGVTIGLSGSDAGINYQLYMGGSPITMIAGTGSSISFGLQTSTGVYTVVATNTTTSCVSTMTGSATIAINPLPNSYSVTGGGGYCTGGTGVTIGLSASDAGINYQLYYGTPAVGSPVAGTGSGISFGLQTTAGTYTAIATDATTGCTANMAGSALVTINTLPTIIPVSGGGAYCSGPGLHVYLGGSNFGISYQLFMGTTAIGSPLPGTGSGLDFGPQTTTGTYTVVATNTSTLCASNMSGSAVITISLPTVYAMTGGGSYCSGGIGVNVGLSNSDSSISYQLYTSGTPSGTPLMGASSALSFGLQTTAGTYTVVATNITTGCTSNMSGSSTVSVNPLPTAYTVTGGGSYCSGGGGVHVTLSSSDAGINYQLYVGTTAVGTPVSGTGAAIDFGLETSAGVYTVVATNASTSCTGNMPGSATITVNPAPTVYTVTGGGSYCSGGTGVAIGLSNSQNGINYQLYNGASAVGSPVTSSGGSPITFGVQTASGTYAVVATDATTACTNNMTGSAVITVTPLPNVYAITGGGSYCTGGTGVAVSLANSDTGINYQLYLGTTAIGSAIAGTGAAISFGSQTSAGTYTAIATNATAGCTMSMSGSTAITINPLPAVVSVTGGGAFCSGGTGVNVGVSGSAIGINYQLYNGTSAVGSPVAGIGHNFDFGSQTTGGTYTVVATNPTTGCANNMSGSAAVTVNPLPVAYTVTGGGSFCLGSLGLHVYLSGSDVGVTYKLYIAGIPISGLPTSGTGASIDFGLFITTGIYSIVATNSATGCTNNMTGSTSIALVLSPSAGTITGPSTVHDGASITLTDAASGGVWSSSTPTVVTVGSSTGVVTGVSSGYANIFYTVTNSCGTALTVATIHELGPAPLAQAPATSGNTTICVGGTTTLTNSVSGGTWSSGNDNVAAIDAQTGVVTGYSAGIAAITYTIVNTDTVMIFTPVVVNAVPDAITVTAKPGTSITTGEKVTLSAAVNNGSAVSSYQWLLNNEAIPGATSAAFTSSSFANNDKVACEVYGECGNQPVSSLVIISVAANDVITQTQTKSISKSDIQVLPNPNNGTFIIKGTLGTSVNEEVSIAITDMLGQIVYRNKIIAQNGEINEQIQLTHITANGMYLLTFYSGAETKIFHMIIEQ